MNFKPMFDRILVKRLPENESAGGIALPAKMTTLQMMDRGVVVAVGEGRRTNEGNIIPLILKGEERVYFLKGTGYALDSEHLVMHEADIMGTVE